MRLIAGLGNPGARYRSTRHNVGFRVVDLLGESLGVGLENRRFHSRNGQVVILGKKAILLRPLTYMNRSGESIRACVDYFGIGTGHIVVIHDDLDLPVGKVKVVRNGGAGGHKGVLSIMGHLGSRAFHRVKIGIGRPRYGESIEEFVLNPFYGDEQEPMERVVETGIRACKLFISHGLDAAMNEINPQN